MPAQTRDRSKPALIVGVALAVAGLVDAMLRCLLLGAGDGLLTAAHDPGKLVFHVVLLPFAAAELVRRFPVNTFLQSLRNRLIFGGLIAVAAVIGGVVAYDDAVDAFRSRIMMPADIAEPAVRQELQQLRDCFGTSSAVRDTACEGDYVADYKRRLEEIRDGAASMFGATSAVFAWSLFLSFLGALFVALVFAIIVALLVLRQPPDPALYSSFIVIVMLCVLWLPLRAYSEWYINFGDFSIRGYPIMVPAIVLSVAGVCLLWLAQLRTRRARQVVLSLTTALPIALSVVAGVRPQWFDSAAQAIQGLSGAQLATVYGVVLLTIVAGYFAIVGADESGGARIPASTGTEKQRPR